MSDDLGMLARALMIYNSDLSASTKRLQEQEVTHRSASAEVDEMEALNCGEVPPRVSKSEVWEDGGNRGRRRVTE